ncbi:hydrogenase iron-sulfur subunit [Desulfobacula sp.]|uniref:hydrogenase iron-sulfur subunit n=1 Tax=Desulfobacula sp. TaxID=2593537 RepID=UPI0025B7A94C|nr:hydrogenase iron-sulfur subunit [Desulfobacula sp.]MBC2703367.1 hydrogenase iron-sulfur subunit [Desulfobacula sp.]
MKNFEPEIVAFCCHYCAYTAADMAGSKRISYPSNVKIIRIPCTGKVDAIHIMKALEKGADGVYVAGCLEGDCHFKNGNTRARYRVEHVQKYLEELGWEPERVAMINMSAGMGEFFARTALEFTQKIKQLGPNPIKIINTDKNQKAVS